MLAHKCDQNPAKWKDSNKMKLVNNTFKLDQ